MFREYHLNIQHIPKSRPYRFDYLFDVLYYERNRSFASSDITSYPLLELPEMDIDGCPEIRLLATDVDHTITNCDGRIDKDTLEAFALLAERNIPVILASGRPFPVVRGLAEYLLPATLIAGVIGENGGVLQLMGENPQWPRVVVHKPLLLENDTEPRSFFGDFLADCGVSAPAPADDNFSRSADLTLCTRESNGKTISQKTMDRIKGAVDMLDKEYRGFLRQNNIRYEGCDAPLAMNYSTVHMHFYHKTKTMNKGEAVLTIIESTGLKSSQALAVGDSLNDVPMFRCFECRAAPANIRNYTGSFEKEIEDLQLYISGKPYSSGFLEIVRFFFPTELVKTHV